MTTTLAMLREVVIAKLAVIAGIVYWMWRDSGKEQT